MNGFVQPEKVLLVDLSNKIITTWDKGVPHPSTEEELAAAREILFILYKRVMN